MFLFVLSMALGAASGPVKLASPGLSGLQVKGEVAGFYSDHLAQQLALQGLSVMTTTDINSLLGLERQKQLLGCSTEASSCMTELAEALGVDGIVMGSIAKFDTFFQIDVKVVAATDGRKLAIFSATAQTQREVLDALATGAASLREQVLASLGRSVSGVSAAGSSSGSRRWWWIPAAGAGAFLVAGAVMMALVAGSDSALRGTNGMPSSLTFDQARTELANGNTLQFVGVTSFAIGGAALLAAGGLLLFGSAPVSVTPSVSVGGGGFVISGSFR